MVGQNEENDGDSSDKNISDDPGFSSTPLQAGRGRARGIRYNPYTQRDDSRMIRSTLTSIDLNSIPGLDVEDDPFAPRVMQHHMSVDFGNITPIPSVEVVNAFEGVTMPPLSPDVDPFAPLSPIPHRPVRRSLLSRRVLNFRGAQNTISRLPIRVPPRRFPPTMGVHSTLNSIPSRLAEYREMRMRYDARQLQISRERAAQREAEREQQINQIRQVEVNIQVPEPDDPCTSVDSDCVVCIDSNDEGPPSMPSLSSDDDEEYNLVLPDILAKGPVSPKMTGVQLEQRADFVKGLMLTLASSTCDETNTEEDEMSTNFEEPLRQLNATVSSLPLDVYNDIDFSDIKGRDSSGSDEEIEEEKKE